MPAQISLQVTIDRAELNGMNKEKKSIQKQDKPAKRDGSDSIDCTVNLPNGVGGRINANGRVAVIMGLFLGVAIVLGVVICSAAIHTP